MNGTSQPLIYEFSGFRLDLRRQQLLSPEGQPIPLTLRVFNTLMYFIEHRGELLDKGALMEAIWPDTVVEENNLNQAISALRKALGEKTGEHRFIVNEPGRGYRFVAEVQIVSRESNTEPSQPSRFRAGWTTLLGLLLLVLAVGYFYMNRTGILTTSRQAQKEQTVAVVSPPATGEKVVVVSPLQSIAVLPFVNMSPDKDQEYFAEGVAEEVLNQLTSIRDLVVIGRMSSFSFKGKNEDLRVIGEKLGVSYLLEGSVRKEGKRVRITAQLVKAEDGRNLWSRSYARNLEDIFAIQDDIAKSVANALQITLGVGKLGRRPGMTRNIAAYDAFLNADSMLNRFGRDNFTRAIEQLEKATALDPNFAIAWEALAQAYVAAADTTFITERADEYLAKSESADRRAESLVPESINALFSSALRHRLNREWMAQQQSLIKAYTLAPGSFGANMRYGNFLISTGRPGDAIEYFHRAARVEPLRLGPALDIIIASEYIGDFDAALEKYEETKGLVSDTSRLNAIILRLAIDKRDHLLMNAMLEKTDNTDMLPRENRTLTPTMHLLLDSPDKAMSALHRFYEDPVFHNPYTLAVMAIWASYFEDYELALKALGEATLSRRGYTYPTLWRPIMKPMRQLHGFKDLVTKLGLVDYWRETGNWGEFCHPVGEDDFECI